MKERPKVLFKDNRGYFIKGLTFNELAEESHLDEHELALRLLQDRDVLVGGKCFVTEFFTKSPEQKRTALRVRTQKIVEQNRRDF